jgi:transcription elongation factor Elf1
MKCPICKSQQQVGTMLRSDGFKEGITECSICGAVWSVNHGVTEMVKDPQLCSFLEVQSECVDGDDYGMNVSDKKSGP